MEGLNPPSGYSQGRFSAYLSMPEIIVCKKGGMSKPDFDIPPKV